MYVCGFMSRTGAIPTRASCIFASNFGASFQLPSPNSRDKRSRAIHPALCRVRSYVAPWLPRPMMMREGLMRVLSIQYYVLSIPDLRVGILSTSTLRSPFSMTVPLCQLRIDQHTIRFRERADCGVYAHPIPLEDSGCAVLLSLICPQRIPCTPVH